MQLPRKVQISGNYLVEKKYEQTKQHTCLVEEKKSHFLDDDDDKAGTLKVLNAVRKMKGNYLGSFR